MASGGASCSCKSSTVGERKRKRWDEPGYDSNVNSHVHNNDKNRESSEDKIQRDISGSKGEDLQSLPIEIQYDIEITPLELIKNHHSNFQSTKSTFFLRKYIDEIEEYFLKQCNFLKFIDYDFGHMTRTEAEVLRNLKFYPAAEFLSLRSHLGVSATEIDNWFGRFHASGIRFAESLFYSIVKRDLDVRFDSDGSRVASLCKYDFQFLFDSFASMFGLRSFTWFAPCVPERELKLCKKTITGKADILFCQDVAHTLERPLANLQNIIAVCDVKNESHGKSDSHFHSAEPQLKSWNACSVHSSKNSLPPNMSSSQLKQHGEHLLLYSQQSFAEDAVYGIIIQQTKVSFTVLRMTKCEYKGIVNGKLEMKTPKLIITRPYDYLKEEDRKFIIRPLLELAMIQENQLFS